MHTQMPLNVSHDIMSFLKDFNENSLSLLFFLYLQVKKPQFISSFMRRRALSLTDLVGMCLKLKCWKLRLLRYLFSLSTQKNLVFENILDSLIISLQFIQKQLFTDVNYANFLKRDPNTDFFSEICEIFKNTFSNRTPPVAASVNRSEIGGNRKCKTNLYLPIILY